MQSVLIVRRSDGRLRVVERQADEPRAPEHNRELADLIERNGDSIVATVEVDGFDFYRDLMVSELNDVRSWARQHNATVLREHAQRMVERYRARRPRTAAQLATIAAHPDPRD
jgi:hypothetical protein